VLGHWRTGALSSSVGTGALCPEAKRPGRETHHPHLLSRLRMCLVICWRHSDAWENLKGLVMIGSLEQDDIKMDVDVEVKVNLRPTVSRPVCLGVRHPSWTRDQFFFLLEISFRQLWVYYFVAPSLTRGRICNLLYN
jgi:hypothetical protein